MSFTYPLELAFLATQYKSLVVNTTSRLLPPKPTNKSQPWDMLYTAAIDEPTSLKKWDELFAALENSWNMAKKRGELDTAIKTAIVDLFHALLSVYPYLTGYWLRFIQIQLKIGNEQDYLETLKMGVSAHPQSVALWTEYLTALTKEHNIRNKKKSVNKTNETKSTTKFSPGEKNSNDPESMSIELELESLRLEFRRGADAIGRNFYSELFWDAYIDFESLISATLTTLIDLYLEIVSIPLYSYAHFYNKFIEAAKSFRIEEIIRDLDNLQILVQNYGKSSPDELASEESQQILDTFSYDIFIETQRRVTEKWSYESEILIHDFEPVSSPALDDQYLLYLKYLDHEEDLSKTKNQADQKKVVVNLFERALVPHCHQAELWQKYLAFLRSTLSSFEELKDVYERAIFSFVPVENNKLREDYAQFLMNYKKFDLANEFLIRSSKLFLGESNKLLYIKPAYIHDLRLLVKLWGENLAAIGALQALEDLVSGYFDRVDRYKKHTKEKALQKKESAFVLDAFYINAVSKILNNDGICIVAIAVLRLLSKDSDNTEKIRNFYNKYHPEPALGGSVQFWNFYVMFEGSRKKNFLNLMNIISFIKERSSLPKRAVDAFIQIQYELTCSNLTKVMSFSCDSLLLPLISVHSETSSDFFVNEAARKRIANSNVDPQNSQASKEGLFLHNLKKHIGHPGVLAENAPEITNSWIDKEWIPLTNTASPPPLPAFRNVEKASAPLVYHDN